MTKLRTDLRNELGEKSRTMPLFFSPKVPLSGNIKVVANLTHREMTERNIQDE